MANVVIKKLATLNSRCSIGKSGSLPDTTAIKFWNAGENMVESLLAEGLDEEMAFIIQSKHYLKLFLAIMGEDLLHFSE